MAQAQHDHQPGLAFEHPYQPQDALAASLKSATYLGAGGLLVSTVQNTLTRQNVGAFAIFTRTGGAIAAAGVAGGVYGFAKNAAANLREQDDIYNTTIGGFCSGAIIGLAARSAPLAFAYGATTAAILSAFNYTGGSLSGFSRDPNVDEVSRKEEMRKNRRRPLEETINQLGEGRGIYAPGYAERRAERIKANYGIDVPEHSKFSSVPN